MGFFGNKKGPEYIGTNRDGILEELLEMITNRYLDLCGPTGGGISQEDILEEIQKTVTVECSLKTIDNKVRRLADYFPEFAEVVENRFYPVKKVIREMFYHRRLEVEGEKYVAEVYKIMEETQKS